MSKYPNPTGNPTLEGYDILATSPAVVVSEPNISVRALVVRYADHQNDRPHILWQVRGKATDDEWHYLPGSNANNCEAVIMALMGTK